MVVNELLPVDSVTSEAPFTLCPCPLSASCSTVLIFTVPPLYCPRCHVPALPQLGPCQSVFPLMRSKSCLRRSLNVTHTQQSYLSPHTHLQINLIFTAHTSVVKWTENGDLHISRGVQLLSVCLFFGLHWSHFYSIYY